MRIQSELTGITDGQLTFTNTPYVKAYRPQENWDRDRGGYGKPRGESFSNVEAAVAAEAIPQ